MTEPKEENVAVDETQLISDGFTQSGSQRYVATVRDFARELLKRTINFAEASGESGMPREATHEHVRLASKAIAGASHQTRRNMSAIWVQAFEYLSMAIAGAGASHLSMDIGIFAFVGGAAAAVLLMLLRLTVLSRGRL